MITMTALHSNPFFDRLADAENILVTGAGGGFDIYAGLPVALSLMHQGKRVHLANLSFSALAGLPTEAWAAPDLAAVTPGSAPHLSYFPERTLAQWLQAHGYPATVYAFPQTGVQPLRAAYRELIGLHRIDAIVLVDGGTDILMRGDEAGLGTPRRTSPASRHSPLWRTYPSASSSRWASVWTPTTGSVTAWCWRTSRLWSARAPTSARSPYRAPPGRALSSSTRWPMPRSRPRTGPAS